MSKFTESLKEKGIAEDQIVTINECLNASGEWLPKYRFDEVNQEKNNLKTQIDEYNSQMKELQKSVEGNEELKNQIAKMKDDMKELDKKHIAEIEEMQLNNAIRNELVNDFYDADVALSKMDKSLIKYDKTTGKVTGLKEQKDIVKQNFEWLVKKETNPQGGGFKPQSGSSTPPPQGNEEDESLKLIKSVLPQNNK